MLKKRMINSFKILRCIFSLIFMIFSLFGCKSKAPSFADCLENEYPNRFQVLDTFTDDIIGNLSFSVKTSIVAEKSNNLIQTSLNWDKRLENFNLSKSKLDSAFSKAQREYKDALSLYKTTQENGLKEIAVGIKNGTVFILIFAEPTLTHRKNSLLILEKCFAKWQKEGAYEMNISYLEPSEKDMNFKEIVPLLYWRQSVGEFKKNMVYSTICPYNETFLATKVGKNWEYNTSSDRFMYAIEKARIEGKKWASGHLRKPYEILETVEFNQIEKNPTIVNIKFPITYQSKETESASYNIEADGYISMDYNVENNTLMSKIKMTKE